MNILNVFCNDSGEFGDATAIIIDEKNEISAAERQKLAKDSGYDEIAFINNVKTGEISIYGPIGEVDFAGQVVLAAAWFWRNFLHKSLDQIVCRNFTVKVGSDNGTAWALAPVAKMPPWNIIHEEDLNNLDNMAVPTKGRMLVWSWLDQKKGIVRARSFAPDWGFGEVEVSGSGSVLLAGQQGQKLTVFHGAGSIINVEPTGDGFCRLSGFVKTCE